MSATSHQELRPDLPAAPQAEGLEAKQLRESIAELVPTLYRADSSAQLSDLLNIIATARAMGKDGFTQLITLCKTLRKMRAFDDLYILTSEMNAHGMASPLTQRFEIQALIELGVFETALDLVRPLLVAGVGNYDAREAYGHLGRIYKQMYVDAVKAAKAGKPATGKETLRHYLERSFAAYMHVWENVKTEETAYQGINAVAVAYLAVRDGIVDADADAPKLAEEVLAMVSGPNVKDPWANATRGEALVALGRYKEAAAAYALYAATDGVDPFALAGSLRQLEELWQIDGEDPEKGVPVRLLKVALIAKASEIATPKKETDSNASKIARQVADLHAVEVSMSPKETRLASGEFGPNAQVGDKGSAAHTLQKIFTDAFPMSGKLVFKGMQRADAVCRIHGPHNGYDQAFASGFAIRGDLLCTAWGPKPVIVTNNHVISSGGNKGKRLEVCRAVFVSPTDEPDQDVFFDSILWESDIDAHDVTVLSIKGDLPAIVTPLNDLRPVGLEKRACHVHAHAHANETPATPVDENGIGRCYIIGYPNGGGLAYSYADNILLDHDAPADCDVVQEGANRIYKNVRAEPVHIHYKTPTVGGSSGSPVFDTESFALIGVHHSGSEKLQRLPPNEGIYAANEGIWIDSVRQAIAETMAIVGTEASSVARKWRAVTPTPLKPSTPEPRLVTAATTSARLIEGSFGDSYPGLSTIIGQVLHPPGKATQDEMEHSKLESITNNVDSRVRIFDTRMSPWRMIVSIRSWWGARLRVGTGCFIGPNTILTAGHVVHPADLATYPSEIEVIPGLNDAERPYGTLKPKRMVAHPLFVSTYDPKYDIAVIHLDEAIGQKVGWFGLASRPTDELRQQWVHITGYPGEKELKLPATPGGPEQAPVKASQLWHHSSPVMMVENNRIFYGADTTGGQSGAPIYMMADAAMRRAPVVVGVHAYGVVAGGQQANSGAWIDSALFDTINGWRNQSAPNQNIA